MNPLTIVNIGRTHYKHAWDLQRKLFALRLEGKIADVLLLTEHEHVYTLGKASDDAHLLADDRELKASGAEVFRIDRGGDITYHGPGQLVGYPILDLNMVYHDLHRYLRDLEEVIIRTLGDYGIGAARDAKFTGVWVGSSKIAAIGVKVSRWITMHGFALNVDTDLSYFDRIIPCGIFHKGVTSMSEVTGRAVDMVDVSRTLARHFCAVFRAVPTHMVGETFIGTLDPSTSEKREWLQVENQ